MLNLLPELFRWPKRRGEDHQYNNDVHDLLANQSLTGGIDGIMRRYRRGECCRVLRERKRPHRKFLRSTIPIDPACQERHNEFSEAQYAYDPEHEREAL